MAYAVDADNGMYHTFLLLDTSFELASQLFLVAVLVLALTMRALLLCSPAIGMPGPTLPFRLLCPIRAPLIMVLPLPRAMMAIPMWWARPFLLLAVMPMQQRLLLLATSVTAGITIMLLSRLAIIEILVATFGPRCVLGVLTRTLMPKAMSLLLPVVLEPVIDVTVAMAFRSMTLGNVGHAMPVSRLMVTPVTLPLFIRMAIPTPDRLVTRTYRPLLSALSLFTTTLFAIAVFIPVPSLMTSFESGVAIA